MGEKRSSSGGNGTRSSVSTERGSLPLGRRSLLLVIGTISAWMAGLFQLGASNLSPFSQETGTNDGAVQFGYGGTPVVTASSTPVARAMASKTRTDTDTSGTDSPPSGTETPEHKTSTPETSSSTTSPTQTSTGTELNDGGGGGGGGSGGGGGGGTSGGTTTTTSTAASYVYGQQAYGEHGYGGVKG